MKHVRQTVWKTSSFISKLVPEHFIGKTKNCNPASLPELLEVWELEIPIKRQWWAIIDLLLAQQADTGEGGSSLATQRAFLSLFQ